jgi:PleD family two-component response regulator
LRAAVAAATLLEGHPITISIGVAYMDTAHEPADWLEQADKMLYAAKQGGRNAVRWRTRWRRTPLPACC